MACNGCAARAIKHTQESAFRSKRKTGMIVKNRAKFHARCMILAAGGDANGPLSDGWQKIIDAQNGSCAMGEA
jgi:hypothetical protein